MVLVINISKHYQYFQIFNILRILQYCKEENIREQSKEVQNIWLEAEQNLIKAIEGR